MTAAAFGSVGNVASFRMQVSRTTRKIGLSAAQCPRAALGFNEDNRLSFRYCFAAVLTMRLCKRRGELKPNNSAFDYGCCIHTISVCQELHVYKRADGFD